MSCYLLGHVEGIVNGLIVVAVPLWGINVGDHVSNRHDGEFHEVTDLMIGQEKVSKVHGHSRFKIKADGLVNQLKIGDSLFLEKNVG